MKEPLDRDDDFLDELLDKENKSLDIEKTYSAEELYNILNIKLKKAAQNTTNRKLSTGEYIIYDGRPVPSEIVRQYEIENKKNV